MHACDWTAHFFPPNSTAQEHVRDLLGSTPHTPAAGGGERCATWACDAIGGYSTRG